MDCLFTVKGVQGILKVFENKITLKPKGLLGLINLGIKGEKMIPMSSVTSIQFRKAGFLTSGYMQFSIPGGNESKGGLFKAVNDENTFVFKAKSNKVAHKIKDFIEEKILSRS